MGLLTFPIPVPFRGDFHLHSRLSLGQFPEDKTRTEIHLLTQRSIIIIMGLLFFPESPRHLVEKGREEEALNVVSEHGLVVENLG